MYYLPVVQFPDTLELHPQDNEQLLEHHHLVQKHLLILQGTTFAKGITLNENFFFEKPRIIASTINETNELKWFKIIFLRC